MRRAPDPAQRVLLLELDLPLGLRELAQLTSTSKGNVGACVDGSRMGPDGDCLSGADKIQVFPFALQFNEAEKFCVDMGGHLASIHDRAEYNTLTAATQIAGVTNSVLIGGFEDDLPGGGKRMVMPSKGVEYTIVNGEITYTNTGLTGAKAGTVLRS